MTTFLFSSTLNFALQEITPRIYMADSDFDALTNNGEICDAEGNVGVEQFVQIMQKEIR